MANKTLTTRQKMCFRRAAAPRKPLAAKLAGAPVKGVTARRAPERSKKK
ncbi:hypothetical protein AAKU55_002088 [Oxalobacteraceae bacterium GrIS 1.11]